MLKNPSMVGTLAIALVALAPAVAAAQVAAADLNEPRIASANGKTVRVTEVNGSRQSGRLVSLAGSGVVIRSGGKDVSIPMANVRKVERTTHNVLYGLAIGGAAGFVYGWGVTEPDGSGSGREAAGGAIVGAIGAAGGAGVGALIDRLRRGSHLVYVPAARTKTVAVLPLVGSSRRGLAIAVKW